jgi:hypothetical protein
MPCGLSSREPDPGTAHPPPVQAEIIVKNQRHANLGSVKGLRAWRNMVVAVAKDTQAKGGCPLGSLGGQLAESDPEARALIAAGFEQWSTAISDGLRTLHADGQLPSDIDQTISPSLCSPRSKEDSSWPKCNGALVRSKLQSIRSLPLPLPSADEPRVGPPCG